MSCIQFEAQAQSKSQRAFHAKVRTGCLTCKRRRVRCDERKPCCKGCARLGHLCEYAPPAMRPKPKPKPMPTRPQHTLLPAPVPMWTEADSLRTAYYHAFQRYDPIGLSNSEAFAHVIPRESFSDDVYYHICMSMGSLSLSPVARSPPASNGRSLVSLATSSPADAHHAKAISYYTTALRRLRERLGSGAASLSPRVLLLSMGAMACFEIMQGNMVASCQIQLACFSVLSDAVIFGARGPGGSERFGLAALYEGDLAVEETEAVQLRLAAMCLLGAPGLFRREDPRTVPIPRPAPEKPPRPDAAMGSFQRCWNAFAQRLESWKLACYWAVCLNGTSAELRDFLDDQRVLAGCLQSWEKVIRSRIRLSGHLSLDQSHVQALRLLLMYTRSTRLFLAPEDEDPLGVESLHATDMADLARLPLRPMSRFIGGFLFGSWNDFMVDSRLIPLIKFMVLKRQCPAGTFNRRLAELQADLGEAIWLVLEEYYERSRKDCDAGFIPVQSRISWTFLWWKHFWYRGVFETAINDMSRDNAAPHPRVTQANGSNGL